MNGARIKRYGPRIHVLLACVLVAGWTPRNAVAIPASPYPFEVTQPDGTRVLLRIRGDEYFHWLEDLNHFTVVRDGDRYVYADVDADGELVPTDSLVGKVDPRSGGLSPRTLPGRVARLHRRAELQHDPLLSEGPLASTPPVGTIKNVVILMRFTNHAGRLLPSSAHFDTIFNAVGGDPTLAPTGSVRDVYFENSYGVMTLDSTVFGWVNLPHSESYYANGYAGLSSMIWEAIIDALNLADGLIDFSQFDENGDGFVDAITFIHSGYGAEWGGTDVDGAYYLDRIWSHRWSIPTWTSAEGVKVSAYHINPGLWGLSGSAPGHIGVICHESGHFFGLPDLYDTDGLGEGIGSYGMMANSWGFTFDQLNPPHFCAWSKIFLGWATPTVISSPGTYTVQQVETNAQVYRINVGYPVSSDEYLLVENREPVGFESTLPQGGLAIWHIDENKCCNTDEGYPGQLGWPGNNEHYRVALLQADGNFELERSYHRGDGDELYHANGVDEINSATTPNTDAYRAGTVVVTNNTISAISSAGPSMTFEYSVESPPAPSLCSSLDTDPGWSVEGEWAFGSPTGQGSEAGDPTGGATGSNVYGVNLNGDYAGQEAGPYYVTAGPFDLQGQTGVKLQYQRWLGTDWASYAHHTIDVSNNGTSWTRVWENVYDWEINDEAWWNYQIDISDIADGRPNVFVRWGYETIDDVYPRPGWNIDDICFVATEADLSDLWIDDASMSEGDSGATDLDFVVSLSEPAPLQISVDWATENGSATAGADYVGDSGKLVIPQGEATGVISVSVIGDTDDESNETFFVNLTNGTNAAIVDDQATGFIYDDDGVIEGRCLYREDFDDGPGGYVIDNNFGAKYGLWRFTEACRATMGGHSAPAALFYGVDDDGQCDYDAGRTEGVVASPAISLEGLTPPIQISFSYYLETEQFPGYDVASAEMSTNGSTFWTVASNNPGPDEVVLEDGTGAWQTARIDFSPSETTESLYLRFHFASIDHVNNAYNGFYVDDIDVCGVGEPCLAPVESSAPDPADEATAVPRSVVLTWTGDDTDCRTTYNVYFDTVNPPRPASLACFGVEEPICDVGTLGFGTFYWTVAARNALGMTPGPIWTFTTIDCLSDEDCDDGVACTDDACGAQGCVHTANSGNCTQDGSFCNGLELCDPQLDCISAGDPCAPGLLCVEVSNTCQFDCNSNGIADSAELLLGLSDDCNSNGWPDECEVAGPYALEASFMGLGDLDGGDFESFGLGVSANGRVVVGVGETELGQEAFRWTAEDGMVGLGDLPGGQYESGALEASANGSAIVGAGHLQRDETERVVSAEAFRWTTSGTEGLGDLEGGDFLSFGSGVSALGRVVVGNGSSAEGTLGFRWTPALGMVSLGDLDGDPLGSEAIDVSNDGSVIVGSGNLERNEGGIAISGEAFRWTAGTGLVPLGDLAGGDYLSLALGVSGDGAVVVGASDSDQGSEAFRWTEAKGMVALTGPASVLSSAAYAASRDGSILVGFSYIDTSPQAFIWDESAGMRSIRDVLVDDFGLDLSDWTLLGARDVSDDGQVIVGHGINPGGQTEAWMAVVPRIRADCNTNGVPDECDDVPGDFNGNGYTDASDLPGFAECQTEPCADPPCAPALYENPCCILADVDRDGDVDLDDFSAVQVSFDMP